MTEPTVEEAVREAEIRERQRPGRPSREFMLRQYGAPSYIFHDYEDVPWLLARLDAVRAESAERERALRGALAKFANFGTFIEAAAELGEIDDLTDHTCVVSMMVAGASDYIWMSDLRAARAAAEAILRRLDKSEKV